MHEDERCRQPDTAAASAAQRRPGDVREHGPVAARADLDDRRSCALKVLGIVEITDQDVASVEAALAAADYHDAVRVDVTVVRHRGGDSTGVVKTTDER